MIDEHQLRAALKSCFTDVQACFATLNQCIRNCCETYGIPDDLRFVVGVQAMLALKSLAHQGASSNNANVYNQIAEGTDKEMQADIGMSLEEAISAGIKQFHNEPEAPDSPN